MSTYIVNVTATTVTTGDAPSVSTTAVAAAIPTTTPPAAAATNANAAMFTAKIQKHWDDTMSTQIQCSGCITTRNMSTIFSSWQPEGAAGWKG